MSETNRQQTGPVDDKPLEADLTAMLEKCKNKREAREKIARHCEYLRVDPKSFQLDNEQLAIMAKLY